MSYFNHAFCKTFIATKATQAESGSFDPSGVAGENAGVTAGVLTSTNVHVSKLKSEAAAEGYQLGVGVVGLFDEKTHLSVTSTEIAASCCPFYLAGASIKINDKQGPFHGGYQESHKSKVINPKYVRKTWRVDGNAATRPVIKVGGINADGASTLNASSLVGGSGYANATNVATTGGSGSGLTVDITTAAGAVTAVTINESGTGYTTGDTITITGGGADATIDIATVDDSCDTEFLCGETYYLRVEVKGTPALRFANHNLYQNLQADGGCCDDPSVPVAVDSTVIYKQWGEQIVDNPYLKDFIRPLLVVDGQAYAFTAEAATEEGLDPTTELVANAPTTSTSAGLVLLGAYVDTEFQNCTFQVTDYYGIEPIQLYVSEVDLNGDPCTFSGVCVDEVCPGVQANGSGEQKVRELILSESYLQNFVANDLRIREITQGTRAYEVLNRSSIYSSFYIQHVVPRFNNPSGTFDNDQYVLEIVGTTATLDYLESQFDAIETAGCLTCAGTEDYSVSGCSYTIPNP